MSCLQFKWIQMNITAWWNSLWGRRWEPHLESATFALSAERNWPHSRSLVELHVGQKAEGEWKWVSCAKFKTHWGNIYAQLPNFLRVAMTASPPFSFKGDKATPFAEKPFLMSFCSCQLAACLRRRCCDICRRDDVRFTSERSADVTLPLTR